MVIAQIIQLLKERLVQYLLSSDSAHYQLFPRKCIKYGLWHSLTHKKKSGVSLPILNNHKPRIEVLHKNNAKRYFTKSTKVLLQQQE
jgi:hypothetical protein